MGMLIKVFLTEHRFLETYADFVEDALALL